NNQRCERCFQLRYGFSCERIQSRIYSNPQPLRSGQRRPVPEGVTTAVKAFFDDCLRLADKYGLPRDNLCLDPGFGFGKSREDDYEIVRNMRALKTEGVALLAGASRKRMTNISGSDSPAERDPATAAIHTLCTAGGSDIIRVHNVETAAKAAAAADRICRKANNG
ncbi:MAG: dihydropteroate synthase, partial [Clostridia bacterium]|nr:dihydropteroate synthase [Clostridia bacterium]